MSSTIGEIQDIPLDKILADDKWNCRGKIVPGDVLDLIRDIQENGLQTPVTVMPYANPLLPQYQFKLIAGYRRYTTFTILRKDHPQKFAKIPCLVKANLDELTARTINLQENLIRKQLNIMQEAAAVQPFFMAGFSEKEVADRFKQSRGWAQVRNMLLQLPGEIQKEAAAGLLTQENIRQLYSLPEHQRFAAAKEIKERKERGEKRVLLKMQPKNVDTSKPKLQSKDSIENMIERVGRMIGMGLHTRLLAWAAGNIAEDDLMADLKDYCEENGFEFNPQEEETVEST